VKAIDDSYSSGYSSGSSLKYIDATQDSGTTPISDNTATLNISVTNGRPEVDLNGTNGAGTGYSTVFSEGGASVAIADLDVSISDTDSTQLKSATIVLTNAKQGDTLSVGTMPSGISAGTPDTSVAGKISITLTGTAQPSGTASLDDFEAALKQIVFSNNSDNPDTTPRIVETVVLDHTDRLSNPSTTTISITPQNDAPVVDEPTIDLPPQNEDSGAPSNGTMGTLVSDLLSESDVTDPDGPNALSGIAIIGANSTSGSWHYRTDAVSTWKLLGSPTDAEALLLTSTARVYFQPNNDFNGPVTSALTFRAWDQSDGRPNGSTADLSGTLGGTTAFSTDTVTANLTVTAVNDVPKLTGTPAALEDGIEDTDYTILKADLLAGYTDVDNVTLDVSNLVAINGGVIATVDDDTWTFKPNLDFNGSVNLTYNVIDGSGGSTPATQSFTLAAVDDKPRRLCHPLPSPVTRIPRSPSPAFWWPMSTAPVMTGLKLRSPLRAGH
jgi:hypothetical protein